MFPCLLSRKRTNKNKIRAKVYWTSIKCGEEQTLTFIATELKAKSTLSLSHSLWRLWVGWRRRRKKKKGRRGGEEKAKQNDKKRVYFSCFVLACSLTVKTGNNNNRKEKIKRWGSEFAWKREGSRTRRNVCMTTVSRAPFGSKKEMGTGSSGSECRRNNKIPLSIIHPFSILAIHMFQLIKLSFCLSLHDEMRSPLNRRVPVRCSFCSNVQFKKGSGMLVRVAKSGRDKVSSRHKALCFRNHVVEWVGYNRVFVCVKGVVATRRREKGKAWLEGPIANKNETNKDGRSLHSRLETHTPRTTPITPTTHLHSSMGLGETGKKGCVLRPSPPVPCSKMRKKWNRFSLENIESSGELCCLGQTSYQESTAWCPLPFPCAPCLLWETCRWRR